MLPKLPPLMLPKERVVEAAVVEDLEEIGVEDQ
jgi:hypothetical protein